MKISGLILAAGLSSRMGEFKPLMRLGEKTLIAHSIDSLLSGGAQSVTVVLGLRASEVQALLESAYDQGRLRFAVNPAYERTDMLASIKTGITALPPCDAFFLLPGDMPAVSQSTLAALVEAMKNTGKKVVIPTIDGRRKHPPLISASCADDIRAYDGQDGLRGIWRQYAGHIAEVAVDDEGCLIDADTKQDFNRLARYFQQKCLTDNTPPNAAENMIKFQKEGCRK